MTPRDKAMELLLKFKEVYNYGTFARRLCRSTAIECAIISVNEILDTGYVQGEKSSFEVYKFYSQVKIELSKL